MSNGHKWSAQQRAKFIKTMAMKKASGQKTTVIKRHSHFYRLVNGQLFPVKVKKIVAWVIE